VQYLHISQRLSNDSIELSFSPGSAHGPGRVLSITTVPRKFCPLAIGRLFIQLRFTGLSRKNYGGLRRKPYAYQQAAILRERFHRFLRGRDSMNGNDENRCSYFRQSFTYMLNSLQSPEIRGIEMTLLKPEETLHVYLRRHFERVSNGMARQFAEKRDVPAVVAVVAVVTHSSNGSQS
jgi:hypothetical protein